MSDLFLLLGIFVVSVFIGLIGGMAIGIRRERKAVNDWRKNFPHSNFI